MLELLLDVTLLRCPHTWAFPTHTTPRVYNHAAVICVFTWEGKQEPGGGGLEASPFLLRIKGSSASSGSLTLNMRNQGLFICSCALCLPHSLGWTQSPNEGQVPRRERMPVAGASLGTCLSAAQPSNRAWRLGSLLATDLN